MSHVDRPELLFPPWLPRRPALENSHPGQGRAGSIDTSARVEFSRSIWASPWAEAQDQGRPAPGSESQRKGIGHGWNNRADGLAELEAGHLGEAGSFAFDNSKDWNPGGPATGCSALLQEELSTGRVPSEWPSYFGMSKSRRSSVRAPGSASHSLILDLPFL